MCVSQLLFLWYFYWLNDFSFNPRCNLGFPIDQILSYKWRHAYRIQAEWRKENKVIKKKKESSIVTFFYSGNTFWCHLVNHKLSTGRLKLNNWVSCKWGQTRKFAAANPHQNLHNVECCRLSTHISWQKMCSISVLSGHTLVVLRSAAVLRQN